MITKIMVLLFYIFALYIVYFNVHLVCFIILLTHLKANFLRTFAITFVAITHISTNFDFSITTIIFISNSETIHPRRYLLL
jgi:hypothetical protein